MKRVFFIILIMLSALSCLYAKEIYLVEVKGIISEYTFKHLKSHMEKAEASDSIFVVKLDTPGGVLESTRKIVQLFFESKIPIVVYVAPQGARATSAGAFIALASDYLVMAEGTHIGAAHPVNITGDDIKGDMRKKVENDTTAFMRSISQKKGRNEEIAVDMVINSISLTAREALDKKIVDLVVKNEQEFLEKVKEHFKLDTIPTIKKNEPTITEKIAFFLTDPNVIVMLVLIAIAAIFLEFKMPGSFIFASIGIAAIILFLLAINVIPINYLGLLLIFAGIALLIAEVFIVSFGLLSIAGIVSLASGLYILFKNGGNMGIGVSIWFISAILIFFVAIILAIGRLIIKDMRKKSYTGAEGMLEKIGVVIDWDSEKMSGKAKIHGEIWNITSSKNLKEGDKIRVVKVEDLLATVEHIDT
ncbi:MAG: nodulation protein NfeD [Calditerrivibrio sp.]|nr:nodulation protein NfeD [Calditerrivibrio sp.]